MFSTSIQYLIIVVGMALAWVVIIFNRLVRYKNHCTEAWSNVDTELKRRHDLIPNLVSTVEAYSKHENKLFTEVAQLRSACLSKTITLSELAQLEDALAQGVAKILVFVEDYPKLKASENFLALQRELISTEDRIQSARRFFNGNVREYNNEVEKFPGNLVAQVTGFKAKEFFEVDRVEFPKVEWKGV